MASCYETSPMSLEIALCSEFRRSINFITIGLAIDLLATPRQCREAMTAIAIKTGVSIRRLVESFPAKSSRLVCESMIGMPFIVELRCM